MQSIGNHLATIDSINSDDKDEHISNTARTTRGTKFWFSKTYSENWDKAFGKEQYERDNILGTQKEKGQ